MNADCENVFHNLCIRKAPSVYTLDMCYGRQSVTSVTLNNIKLTEGFESGTLHFLNVN